MECYLTIELNSDMLWMTCALELKSINIHWIKSIVHFIDWNMSVIIFHGIQWISPATKCWPIERKKPIQSGKLNFAWNSTLFLTDSGFLSFSYEKLVNGVKKFDTEGLNSLKYEVRTIERKALYTWILAEIKQESVSQISQIMAHVYLNSLLMSSLFLFFSFSLIFHVCTMSDIFSFKMSHQLEYRTADERIGFLFYKIKIVDFMWFAYAACAPTFLWYFIRTLWR